MTHKDIYIKFMIEYDKANVTSSYPSLTEYEVATVLDKAYNALIALKVTGNNPRRSMFESDVKSVSDINPLLKRRLLFIGLDGDTKKGNNIFTKIDDITYTSNQYDKNEFTIQGDIRSMPDNMRSVAIPDDMLYFVAGAVPVDMHVFSGWMNDDEYYDRNVIKPMDNKRVDYDDNKFKSIRLDPVKLVSHKIAEQFYATSYNIPWIKNPVCFLEDGRLYLLVDPIVGIPNLRYKNPDTGLDVIGEWMSITYVKKPNLFTKDIQGIKNTISNTDASTTYVVNENLTPRYNESISVSRSIFVDRYNKKNGFITNDYKIHISYIGFEEHTDLSGVITFPKTYYIKDYIKEKQLSQFKADEIINLTLQIGSESVTDSGSDTTCSLSPGGRLLLIGYKDQKISKLYCIEYDDLLNLIRQNGVIGADGGWEADGSENGIRIPLTLYTSAFTYDSITEDISELINNIEISYFKYLYNGDGDVDLDNVYVGDKTLKELYTFELDDVVAGELITLAVSYALENVESPRFNNHIQMRGLEA